MILPFFDELKEPIQKGTKIHTFRANKRWRAGILIHFYAQTRRPGMHLFYPVQPVISVQDAELTQKGLHIDGRLLDRAEFSLFAKRDGFVSEEACLAFFKKRKLPIVGQVIHWTAFRYLHPTAVEAPGTVADYICQLLEARPGLGPLTAGGRELLLILITAVGEMMVGRPAWRNTPCTVENVLGALRNRNATLEQIGLPVGSTQPVAGSLLAQATAQLSNEAVEAACTYEVCRGLLSFFIVELEYCKLDMASFWGPLETEVVNHS